MKIKISTASYNEIAAALEKEGRKIGDNATIQLEKGDQLEHPIDYRLATIRRDAVVEAGKAYQYVEGDFVEFCDKVFDFIVNGTKPKPTTTGWK